MGSFLPLPMSPEQRLQEEMRRLFMQKLAQQQWQPPQQQPQARPLPGGLPYPPSPREVGRQQMAKVRQQATEEIIGPESRVPGYQGPSAQQVSSQGPTMAAGPSRLDRMMSALKPAARMAESVISPVDAETGMPNVAIGPLSGAGSADDAGRLTERILKRSDVRKGLKHVSEAEAQHWDDFLGKWAEGTTGDEFITQGGSTYKVVDNGATIRNKALHKYHDPKDVGLKPKSTHTVYTSPDDARAVADFGAVTFPVKGTNDVLSKRIQINSGGGLDLLLKHPDGTIKPYRTIQAKPTPEVGLAPVELWASNKWHAGTPIVKINKGLLPQETIPFSVIQEEARKLDPALASRVMRAPPKDPIRHPAVFQHARERVNELNSTVLKMSQQLKEPMKTADKAILQGQIAAMEEDAKSITDWIFRTGSEHGRNLAYHRITAGQTFDSSYWLNRARRLAGGGLDDATHDSIIQILDDGRKALAAGDTAAQEAARTALAQKLSRVEKSGFWETASTVRKAGLLTGVKTSVRNTLGNTSMQVMEETARLPASIVDASISIFSKKHTVVPFAGMKNAAQEGATRGVREAVEILKKGATADDLLKMEIPRELNSGSKALDIYTRSVFRVMSAEDRPFRVYGFQRSIEEQARAAAMTARRAGGKQSIDAMAKELAAHPSEEMIQQAIAYSEFSVFANKTRATEAVRRGMGALSEGQKFAVDLFVPFKATPSNVIARVVEYSGGGVIKGAGLSAKRIAEKSLTPAQQHDISMAFGRGLVGPALIYMGWKMAESGEMTGMTPETPGERATMEEAGRLPGAVKVGDKWQQVAALSPVGNLLTIGATLYEQETKPKPATLPSAISTAAVRTVAEQPFLSGMEDITSVLQSSSNLADAAEKTGQRLFGSFVPTIVADAGRAMDPHRRDTRNQGLMASAKERIPGLRKDLPTRRGVLGEPLPSSPSAFWNPGIGSPAREMSDPVRSELVKNRVALSWPGKKDYESDGEYRARSALTGTQIERQIAALIQTPEYQQADRETKRLLIDKRVNQVRRLIADELRIGSAADRIAKLKQMLQQTGVQ